MAIRKLEIPKRFSLMGEVITVRHDPVLFWENDSLGEARYNSSEIVLQPETEGIPLNRQKYEHVFLHELVHYVLFKADGEMEDPPLYRREELVDKIAGLLRQAFKTAELEE